MPAPAPSLTGTKTSAQHQGDGEAPTHPRWMQVPGAASFSQLLSCGAPTGGMGFVSALGSWLAVPPPHPRKKAPANSHAAALGATRGRSKPLVCLPGASPGCKGSAESRSAGGTPSGGGVEGKGGERGGKARDRKRGAHVPLQPHRCPWLCHPRGSRSPGQSPLPSARQERDRAGFLPLPGCAKRLEPSQSPALGVWDGRRTPEELTLLLQGQLALGLDVLQRGRQVAWQAARVALGVRGALGQDKRVSTAL